MVDCTPSWLTGRVAIDLIMVGIKLLYVYICYMCILHGKPALLTLGDSLKVWALPS